MFEHLQNKREKVRIMKIIQKLSQIVEDGYTFTEFDDCINKLDLKKFVDNLDELISLQDCDNQIVEDLSMRLALAIIKKIDDDLDYQIINNRRMSNTSNKLALVNGEKSRFLGSKFCFFINCLDSKEPVITNQATEFLWSLSNDFLISQLGYIKVFKNHENDLIRKVMATLAIKAIKHLPVNELVNHLSYLFNCINFNDGDVWADVRMVALKIPHECLEKYLQYLMGLDESPNQKIRDLAKEMVLTYYLKSCKPYSKCVPIKYIFSGHLNTGWNISLFEDIVSKMWASDVREEFDYLKSLINSSASPIIIEKSMRFVLDLLGELETEVLANHIEYLTNYRMFDLDRVYANISVDLAMRVMENWTAEQLKAKQEYISCCNKYCWESRETAKIAWNLLMKIPKKEDRTQKIITILTSE